MYQNKWINENKLFTMYSIFDEIKSYDSPKWNACTSNIPFEEDKKTEEKRADFTLNLFSKKHEKLS